MSLNVNKEFVKAFKESRFKGHRQIHWTDINFVINALGMSIANKISKHKLIGYGLDGQKREYERRIDF